MDLMKSSGMAGRTVMTTKDRRRYLHSCSRASTEAALLTWKLGLGQIKDGAFPHQDHADKADNQVVGESDQPGGDEVVNSATTAASKPGHVTSLFKNYMLQNLFFSISALKKPSITTDLQYEPSKKPTGDSEKVGDGETEDETGKLTVAKSEELQYDFTPSKWF